MARGAHGGRMQGSGMMSGMDTVQCSAVLVGIDRSILKVRDGMMFFGFMR